MKFTLSEAKEAFKRGESVTINNPKNGYSKTFQKDNIARMFGIEPEKVRFDDCVKNGCFGWNKKELTFESGK